MNEQMSNVVEAAYWDGFIQKCAEHGVPVGAFLKQALSPGLVTRTAPLILTKLLGRLSVTSQYPAFRAMRPGFMKRVSSVGNRLSSAALRDPGLSRGQAGSLIDMGDAAATRATSTLTDLIGKYYGTNLRTPASVLATR